HRLPREQWRGDVGVRVDMSRGESDPPPPASSASRASRASGAPAAAGGGVAVDVEADGVRVPLSRRRVAWLVMQVLTSEKVGHALVSVTFVGTDAIARLNREHLGHRGPTDVISFALA